MKMSWKKGRLKKEREFKNEDSNRGKSEGQE